MGLDVHTLTAAVMQGKPYNSIGSADRDIAKSLNFVYLYSDPPTTIIGLTPAQIASLGDIVPVNALDSSEELKKCIESFTNG